MPSPNGPSPRADKSFPNAVATAAGGALFVDVLGLSVGVWKIALAPDVAAQLSPVTKIKLPEDIDERQRSCRRPRGGSAGIYCIELASISGSSSAVRVWR